MKSQKNFKMVFFFDSVQAKMNRYAEYLHPN